MTTPTTGSIRLPATPTGAIRTLGANPETAPIMLHPGDAIRTRTRVAYVLILGALTALGPFTVDLNLPAFPQMAEHFHTSAAAIQLTLTGTMIGFGLGQLVIGPLSDKVGRRWPLLIATAAHILASIFAALAPTLPLLITARVLMGMGAAAGGVVAMAVVRDLFGGRRLVVMLSRLALVSGVAPIIAPLIGSQLLIIMPWEGTFLFLAAYGVAMLLCAVLVLPETLPKERREEPGATTIWQRYRSVLSDRVFVGVLIIGGMTFSGLFAYLQASSFVIQDGFGMSPQDYGMLFAVNSIGIVIGTQTSSRLAARFGPQWVLAWSTACLVVFGLAIYFCDLAGLGFWGFIIPLFFFMTACGFSFPCVQVLALDRHGKAAGTAASLIGASNNAVAGAINSIVGIYAATNTAPVMALVMGGCGIVAALSLWFIVRPRSVGMLNP